MGVAEAPPSHGDAAQIPLKSYFEGKCTPVFSVTLEFLYE